MRDKHKEPLRLEGKTVILEEIAPKYFSYVVEWRNNPALNKYLNQPFVLTEELEKKWYEETYVKDDTQGLLVIIDKNTNTPIGTTGWANMDEERRRCTYERLLLGNANFRASASFFESLFVGSDFLYEKVDVIYAHVAIGNTNALRLDLMTGFALNEGTIQYSQNLFVNGLQQQEIYRTKDMYGQAKKRWWKWIRT